MITRMAWGTKKIHLSIITGILALLIALCVDDTSLSPAAARFPSREYTALTVFVEPQTGVRPILSALANASSSIDLVIYQLEDPTVEEALIAARSRGVEVRVLLNGGYYGNKESPANDDAYRTLSDARVPVRWSPSYFALTHQKTLVIDDSQAFIMTFNFTPQYYKTSRDFGVIDSDAADVAAIEAAFDSDWRGSKKTAQQGDDLVWSPHAKELILSLIVTAQRSIDIYNEEMADADVTNALADAAKRGVVVRIVMTDNKNWHGAFGRLTQAGAHVSTFAKKDPIYIHAKMIVADGTTAFVGSQNFSSNSLTKNRELGILLTASSSIAMLEQTFESDWNAARAF